MTSNSDRDIVRSIEKMILPTLSADSGRLFAHQGLATEKVGCNLGAVHEKFLRL